MSAKEEKVTCSKHLFCFDNHQQHPHNLAPFSSFVRKVLSGSIHAGKTAVIRKMGTHSTTYFSPQDYNQTTQCKMLYKPCPKHQLHNTEVGEKPMTNVEWMRWSLIMPRSIFLWSGFWFAVPVSPEEVLLLLSDFRQRVSGTYGSQLLLVTLC